MATNFEVIELKPVEEKLSVEINREFWDISIADNFTHISAEPPFKVSELIDVKTRLLTGELSGRGLSMLAGVEITEVFEEGKPVEPGEGFIITIDGIFDLPKVEFGFALTAEIMAMRGLSAAIVKVDSIEATHIVLKKNEAELVGEQTDNTYDMLGSRNTYISNRDASRIEAEIRADPNMSYEFRNDLLNRLAEVADPNPSRFETDYS
jgi:hypothetical protein